MLSWAYSMGSGRVKKKPNLSGSLLVIYVKYSTHRERALRGLTGPWVQMRLGR